ncbi:MAG: type II secretion system protein GspF [Desulfobacterales bacterium]|nr:type II secretion system protein GspF [Desulfobacterales bacterium]
MPTFTYKASDAAGKIVTGSMEADDEKGVVAGIHDMGCIPMRIKRRGGPRVDLRTLMSGSVSGMFSGVGGKDVLAFTRDLSSLLAAGLPMDRSLSILIDVAEKEKFKEVVGDILKSVRGGAYLSDSLEKFPGIFSRFYVNMVRAGEAGGVLEPVLARMSTFLENAEELKDYIKSAMVYPAFLVCVGGLSIIILMTFVIPKFSVIFEDLGAAIPLSTRLLLDFSDFLRSFWWAVLAGAGVTWFYFKRYANTPSGRLTLDQKKLTLPVVGDFVKKNEMARFARTLGTLIQSGVPILQAITLVKDIIDNQVIAGSMEEVYARVKEGDRLSKPMEEAGLFPSLAVQMITVGEETGKLDEMLLNVGENYEKIVRNTVKRLISLLEPAMILVMGLVVGFIVISMLLAIFSMNELPF